MRKGRLGNAVTSEAVTKLLDGLIAPPKKKHERESQADESEEE
jgi:hypothetical protein